MEKELLNHLSKHILINDLANVVLNYIQPCKFCYYLQQKLNTKQDICSECHSDNDNIRFYTKNEITLFKLKNKLYLKFTDDDYKIFLTMETLFNGKKLKHQSKERFGPVTNFMGNYCDIHEKPGTVEFNFTKDEIILPKNCFVTRRIAKSSSFMIELPDLCGGLDGLERKICLHSNGYWLY